MDILNALIPSAMAQEAAALTPNAGAGGFASFIPLVLMLGVFYFLLIRPQQKKMKEHKAMLEALRRGDKVVTSSGIMGTVYKIDTETDTIQVEVAEDVVVKFVKSAITEVLSKPEPANNNKEIKEIKSAKVKK